GHLDKCGIGDASGTFTGASTGQYIFTNCYSLVPGSGSPAFVFTGLGGTVGINNRTWAGGSTYTLDSACTLSHEVLAGGGTTITTGGANVEVRGICRALTLILSGANTCQFAGITGVITLSGTTTATVNLFGISSSIADTSVTATVNDNTTSSSDHDLILADTNELQTDWTNGGRLDLLLDDIPTVTEFNARTLPSADYVVTTDTIAGATLVTTVTNLTNAATAGDLTATMKASVNTEVDTGLSDYDGPTNTEMVASFTEIKGATWNSSTDTLEAIRDRGDAAWITGASGITDIINIQPLIPKDIDLANTATYRIGLMLFNSLDDLPSTAEITPGTISIDRKAIGSTSWSSIVSDAACSEIAGLVYYDEVFDSGTGYVEGDSIRITLKNQKVTVAANDYEIIGSTGRMFYTNVRQTMRGTDSAALASALSTHDGKLDTAQLDLDIITGTNGVTLATAQGNYAPAIAGDLMGLANDAITSAKYDESTAFPIKSIDSGSTLIARTGADGDTLETLSDEISGVSGVTPAEVKAEVVEALSDIKLDHLVAVADADDPVNDSIIAKMVSTTGDWSTFTDTTDSLQSLRDNLASASSLVTHDGKLDIVDANVDFILEDTNELQVDWTNGGRLDLILDSTNSIVGAQNNLSAAQVNAEVVDVLRTDTVSEMGQGAPPSSPSIEQAINYLYRMFRNKSLTVANGIEIYDDAGSTVLFKATLSDDLTTLFKSEYVTGA
ncbi:MAG: hypothetical protein GY861_28240, partial [bacterium]|nr:hypothetical protein [bacterium]